MEGHSTHNVMCFQLGFILTIKAAYCNPTTTFSPSKEEEAADKPLVKKDEFWQERHEELVAQTKKLGVAINVMFLGDDDTEEWAYLASNIWQKNYAFVDGYNYGMGGDRTQNVLARIAGGELDGVRAKLVVLQIGSNNIGSNTAAEIAKGIKAIIDAIQTKIPTTKILLLSILPRDELKIDEGVHEVNKLISAFDDKKLVIYLDLTAKFETGIGKQISDLFGFDKRHLTEKGYIVLDGELQIAFKKLGL